MATRKTPGWQKALTDYLRDNRTRSYAPGQWDCAIWAAGAVRAMTGDDHLRGFRGYRTIEEGKRRLVAKGYEDHIAYVAAHYEEIDPASAQPGDIAVVGTDSLGIVTGESVWCFGLTASGAAVFGSVRLDQITRAFRT